MPLAEAATLDLPINPNLGFAYVVPYGNQAQFQMGWRGFVQLAMRSGQYKTINVNEIYEEIKKSNRFTGEYEFGERSSDKIVGYMAYFSLINGFEKFLYMSKEDFRKNTEGSFLQTYKRGTGIWSTDFDSMAKKTVLKNATF